jgi:hypothetical protein
MRRSFCCQYTSCGCYSNELFSFNTLHERKLCIESRTREWLLLLLYRVYSVNIDNAFDVDVWSIVYYILDTVYDLIFVHVIGGRLS